MDPDHKLRFSQDEIRIAEPFFRSLSPERLAALGFNRAMYEQWLESEGLPPLEMPTSLGEMLPEAKD